MQNPKDDTQASLHFRGGPIASLVPMATFLTTTVILVALGAPEVEGMILGCMLGLSLGMCLARSVGGYSDRIFTLMANRTSTVAVVCWLWAGVFSAVLAQSGLVEAIVWVGWKTQLTGSLFTVAVFISAALFATAVGTGLGTIIGFTAVMFPAGIALSADPAALAGAILSGAAFGDNLAPISDTTIISAATQETDVGGVVRSRLRYVLPASFIAILLFSLFGGGAPGTDPASAEKILSEKADPSGLPMLIPAAIVFIVAVSGRHFLAALTAGIFSAILLGATIGAFSLADIFHITADGKIGGAAVAGAMGLVPTAILTLLLVTVIGIMEAGGILARLVSLLDRIAGPSIRKAELAIVALVSVTNISVSVNTVAMITAGPLANSLRKKKNIDPHRSANLLDTVSCSFPYILPYSATIIAATSVQLDLHSQDPNIPVVPWIEQASYFYYGLVLFPVMILCVMTGWGRGQQTPIKS